MTFDDYQKFAARTASMEVPHEIRQATFALGLVCEATEVFEVAVTGVDPVVLTKELGDVMWYAAGLCTEHDLSFAEAVGEIGPESDHKGAVQRLVIKAGEVSDFMKKVIGHGHALDEDRLTNGIREVVYAISDLCDAFGLKLEDVMTANIEKLKERYPKGFSSEASINRTV